MNDNVIPLRREEAQTPAGAASEGFMEINVFHSSIVVDCIPGHFVSSLEENDHASTIAQGFAFLCTGEAVLPDGLKNAYLESYIPGQQDCVKYVESLTQNGIVSEQAALIALNETTAIYHNALGPHPGYLLRNYPTFSDSIHPYLIAMVKMEEIPERTKENCTKIWESLPDDAKAQYQDLNQYILVSAASATDQLNDAVVSLKNGESSDLIILKHPSLKPFPGAEIREQPFFDRSLIFPYVQSLQFEIINQETEDKKLVLVVNVGKVRLLDLIRFEVPAMTLLLSKVAEEVGLTPACIVINAVKMEDDEGKAVGTDSVEDIVMGFPVERPTDHDEYWSVKTRVAYIPYEGLIPNKSIVNYSGEDFAALMKEEDHDENTSSQED